MHCAISVFLLNNFKKWTAIHTFTQPPILFFNKNEMPLKIEEIKLEGTKFDNRAKLTVEQRKAIKVLSEQGFSQRKLATMFNVSKRLVQSIITPPVRQPAKKRSKEYWKAIKQKHRARKMELYLEGKIKFKK
nr:MAG: HNH endonuclease [Bacteriophage sp.]